ncbi:MAG TPA: CCA tRNA nucleotidyltransferase [Candidatus Acidoferrum sp.]|nr:CCA tRNA nucleotidyltransferase [Candidatus Acidoferrum sp.]
MPPNTAFGDGYSVVNSRRDTPRVSSAQPNATLAHTLSVESSATIASPRELAQSICATLQSHGYQALIAGGSVRDLLLKRVPVDFDVATDALPDQVMALFPDSLAVGAQFGVVQVWHGEFKAEIATFRADGDYSDGRRPDQVIYTKSPEEDVRRRDFTINGLLMQPETGEVLDFVGGQSDLKAGLIRAIGDPNRRFAEDKLRLIRAVRFAARFGFAIEPQTLAAIQRRASEISVVSAERLRDELTKILTEGNARRGFELLDETGLLPFVLPEIAAMKGVQQPPQYHPEGDVWTHTLLMIEQLPAGTPATLAWGVLLHDVGKPPTFRPISETGDRIRFDGHAGVGERMGGEICRRFRFSNEDTEQIVALIANHMRFKDVDRMRAATLKRFVRMPRFDQHMELHRLDCTSSHRLLNAYNFIQTMLAETPHEEIHPPKLLTGDDLLAMGYRQGPLLGQILGMLEDAQLEGKVGTREDAAQFVRSKFKPKGSAHSEEEAGTADSQNNSLRGVGQS